LFTSFSVSLTDNAIASGLLELCPNLDQFKNEDGEMDLCCSPKQASGMVEQFKIIGSILGRCPSCLLNFKTAFCHMSCSPSEYN
jgi:hypothetical protein